MEQVSLQVPAPSRRRVINILGPSLGTALEWYDFFLYGAVASVIASHFFSATDANLAFIYSLATFATGFAVRPLGAAIFGSIGDRWGRKRTFLLTMTLMGVATVSIGLIPSEATIGLAAPLLLIATRVLQGLAMGGEYGGAIVYVAEQAPSKSRGLHTSFVQITATAGLVLALLAVFSVRRIVGEDDFLSWGWRIPFLLSALLFLVSIWVRMRLQESAAFTGLVARGEVAKAPLREAIGSRGNVSRMALALFGLLAGMTCVWYTSQFYALFYLERVIGLDGATTSLLVATALVAACPAFVFFGWLSDWIGRKPVILAGCLLALMTYPLLFNALSEAANPRRAAAIAATRIVVTADASRCTSQFDLLGTGRASTSCDIARGVLAKAGIPYTLRDTSGSEASVRIGDVPIAVIDGSLPASDVAGQRAGFTHRLNSALAAQGFPAKADPAAVDHFRIVIILIIMMLYATMCYGPVAAALCELFPTHLRYTSVSLPYNLATGIIGGFLPASAFAIVAATGNPQAGLWYPMTFITITVVVGGLFWKDRRPHSLDL